MGPFDSTGSPVGCKSACTANLDGNHGKTSHSIPIEKLSYTVLPQVTLLIAAPAATTLLKLALLLVSPRSELIAAYRAVDPRTYDRRDLL
jgi:hypothetical protein